MKTTLKKCIGVTVLVMAMNIGYSQDTKDYSGAYIYKTNYYFESLTLSPNGSFIYERSEEFIKEKILGNWQIRNNLVVLDSHPQRDRLMVFQFFSKRLKNKVAYVYNKQKELIHYSFFYITSLNDTIKLQNQWKYSTMNTNAKSFFLVDSKGLLSPTYTIQGARSNKFEILFETQRVFENEGWNLMNDQIIPKNELGKNQNYSLKKE